MLQILRSLAYRLRTRPVLGRWALRAIPDIPWTLPVEGIGPLRLRLRRNRSLWLRTPLQSESFPFAMLRHFVRPGDVVYDAGANLGLYARYLISTLGAGRVVAFEPVADNRALLAANLRLGGIEDRVTVMPLALGDEDGEAEFQLDDMQSASGTLSKVTGGEACVGRKNLGLGPLVDRVSVRRLDTLVAEAGLPIPAVIKIDVEGAEGLLLRGATRLLREHSPRLLVELHGVSCIREVLGLLDEAGYSCAGRVSSRFSPLGYAPVDASFIPRIEDMYDIHFLVAARDPADLPAAWVPEGARG